MPQHPPNRRDTIGRRPLTIIALWAAMLIPVASTQTFASDSTTTADRQSRAERNVHAVRLLLKRHCDRCHGTRRTEAGLNLLDGKSLFAVGDSNLPIVVPGAPEAGLLLQRLTDRRAGDIMPLDGEPLPRKDIATIRQWIADGAGWPETDDQQLHWAYTSPQRPEPPAVEDERFVVNPIDRFVQSRLARENRSLSIEAEKTRLIRRVSLALVGLPPSPAEVQAFVNDDSPAAYERVVDRLLASERYGERWAQHWLDLARYADSNGFQADQIRDSWAWRDWVIRSFNDDKPFDRFTVEQLAGDLLPNATIDQKIATGFHRTPTCNVEAGVDPEENRTNQVIDRVNTTGTVFLGTTIECCQCHDHKYDPFSQRDYYRMFACFNNTPLEVEHSSGVTYDFVGPSLPLPLPADQQQLYDQLQVERAAAQEQLTALQTVDPNQFDQWRKNVAHALAADPARWDVTAPDEFTSTGDEHFTLLEDGSLLVSGPTPATTSYLVRIRNPGRSVIGIRIETLTDESLPGNGPGRGNAERPNFILSELNVTVEQPGGDARPVALTAPAADFSQSNWSVSQAIDGDPKTGWAINPHFGKAHWSTFRTVRPVELNDRESLVVRLDQNYGGGRTIGRVRISLQTGDAVTADLPDDILALFRLRTETPDGQAPDGSGNPALTKKQQRQLRDYFVRSNPEIAALTARIEAFDRRIEKLKPPTTLVMVEMESSRETHMLNRGNYLDPGESVEPGVPEILHDVDEAWPANRLGFANWLVSAENPLLARVTVNRWWAELFGRGIVATPEDFGTQCEPPSHPELLDWLACEFMAPQHGQPSWSMKHIHRLMVMSATFRQSGRLSADHLAWDADNVLLARGPRFRLAAEMIRDNALTVSGLLDTTMYGPPIMPYQPDGLWKSVGRNQPRWNTATNEDRFRRGIYVVWKRDAPYPSFVNFDAPDRASCSVQRPRTNTPLQALTLLNDPAYAEMAMALAQRMLTEPADDTPAAHAAHGFRLCVAREPTRTELTALIGLYHDERDKIDEQPSLATSRIKNLLPRVRNQQLDKAELCAWFAVANTLLNLDETITP